MNTVSITDTIRPPMIARASGAYASLPVPSFSAIGISPMTVASDVIRIGRRRIRHDVHDRIEQRHRRRPRAGA